MIDDEDCSIIKHFGRSTSSCSMFPWEVQRTGSGEREIDSLREVGANVPSVASPNRKWLECKRRPVKAALSPNVLR